MAARQATLDEVSFVAEELTGTACCTALRHVRSLADTTPPGRAYSAILTLAEAANRIEDALETTAEALTAGDADSASLELARSVVLIGRMTADAKAAGQGTVANPSYLKRRRVHFDL